MRTQGLVSCRVAVLLEVFDAAIQLFDSESLLLDFVVFLPQKLHLLLVDLLGSSALPAHCRQVLLFLSQFVLDVLSKIFLCMFVA